MIHSLSISDHKAFVILPLKQDLQEYVAVTLV